MSIRSRAVSMMELLVVVIIIGVVVAITLGRGYQSAFEKEKALEGLNNLQVIYNAEKRYHLETGKYYNCTSCNPGQLNKDLGVLVSSNYFTYQIDLTSSGYTANAVRKGDGGQCAGKKISVTESSSLVTKGCDLWL